MKRRRTEVTIETDELWVIRRSGTVGLAWCPECGKEVDMITTDEAIALTRLDARDIYRRVESGLIHYAKTPGGVALICSRSVMKLSVDAS